MSLTFRQLQVLHAVERMGTVNGAAEFLGVSGPAVSMILRDTAAAVGFPLFTRLRGSMRPTQETKMLVASIEKVLDAYADVEKLSGHLASARVGKLLIASIPTLTDHLLPSALAELARTYPEIDSLVVTLRGVEVMEEVRKLHCHVGLTIGAHQADGTYLFNLFKGSVIAVVRKEHPLALAENVRLETLAQFPIVSVPRRTPVGRIFHEACLAAGVDLTVRFEVTHASAAIAFARAGLGVAVVDPLSAPSRFDPDLVVIRLSPPVELTVQLVLPSTERPSRSTLKLISSIRRVAKAMVEKHEMHLSPVHWRSEDSASPNRIAE